MPLPAWTTSRIGRVVIALALSGAILLMIALFFDPVDNTLSGFAFWQARIEFLVSGFALCFLVSFGLLTVIFRYLWWLPMGLFQYWSIARIGDYGYDKDGLAFAGTFWSAFFAVRATRVYLRSGGPDPDIAFPHQLPGLISGYVRNKWSDFRAYIRRRSGAD
jgi:hypothetical protein